MVGAGTIHPYINTWYTGGGETEIVWCANTVPYQGSVWYRYLIDTVKPVAKHYGLV